MRSDGSVLCERRFSNVQTHYSLVVLGLANVGKVEEELLSTLLFGEPSGLGRKGAGMFAERRNSSAMSELPRADRRSRVCPHMLSFAMKWSRAESADILQNWIFVRLSRRGTAKTRAVHTRRVCNPVHPRYITLPALKCKNTPKKNKDNQLRKRVEKCPPAAVLMKVSIGVCTHSIGFSRLERYKNI